MGYLSQYVALGAMLLLGVVFVGASQLVTSVLRPQRGTPYKELAYECGVDPESGEWTQIHVRYYIFAWLYVLFAVEAIFLFPWIFVFDIPEVAAQSAVEMGIFAGLLAIGLLYAWRKGVVRWS